MIREATLNDLDGIEAMFSLFSIESRYNDIIPYDTESARQYLSNVISGEKSVVFVAVKDKEYQGMIGATNVPYIANNNYTITHELFWWVFKEYRNNTISKELLNTAMDWSDEKEISGDVFSLSCLVALKGDVLSRYYKKIGFKPVENTHIKRMK